MARFQPGLVLAILLHALRAVAVDLVQCNIDVQARLDNGSLAPTDPIFYFNGTSYKSQRDNLQLTIAGCQTQCPHPRDEFYSDIGPRLLTWLIPIFLMVGNIHLPRLGFKNRLLIVFHHIGDPIDAMWSLLTKAEVWNRFYSMAQGNTENYFSGASSNPGSMAVIWSAIEELTGDMGSVSSLLREIHSEAGPNLSRQELNHILAETADELVDSRSNEVFRALLTIFNYLWGVLAAFVPSLGGESSSQPGGRIGTAMFLSFIINSVMLSNTLSGFSSRRTCLRILERYNRTIKERGHYDEHLFSKIKAKTSTWIFHGNHQKLQPDDHIQAQPWNGGVYCFRPNKLLVSTNSKTDRAPFFLLSLAALPISASVLCAFAMIYMTPTVGIDCRSLWVLCLGLVFLVSPVLTWLFSRIATGKYHWYLTTIKDGVFTLAILLVVTLSSTGIFNTCWCWSAVYSLGLKKAHILLDPIDERKRNAKTLYPAMVGTCLALQLIAYGLMYLVMRPGAKVFRLSEDEKMESYLASHDWDRDSTELYSVSAARKKNTPDWPLITPPDEERHRQGEEFMPLPPPAISPRLEPRRRGSSATSLTGWNRRTNYGEPSSFALEGSSPERRTSEQPLLGSPSWDPRS